MLSFDSVGVVLLLLLLLLLMLHGESVISVDVVDEEVVVESVDLCCPFLRLRSIVIVVLGFFSCMQGFY